MLDKIIKEAYSVDAALPNSQTICSTTSKIYRPNNMATERGLYSTISIIHNRYHSQKINDSLKMLDLHLVYMFISRK